MKSLKIGKVMFSYILRRCLYALLGISLGLSILMVFLDIMGTASRLPHLDFRQLTEMGLLNFPTLFLAALPYMVMFSFMYAFFTMNKEKHTIIQFSIGLSPLQVLIPPMLIAFVLGVLYAVALTPVASITHEQYKKRWNVYSDISTTTEITFDRNNLWLRERLQNGHRIIHSPFASSVPIVLYQARILEMDTNQKIQRAYSVDKITLQDDKFLLHKGSVTTLDNTTKPIQNVAMPTTVNNDLIQNIITKPTEMSFWELPNYMRSLHKSGLNTAEYVFTYHRLLSMPFMFIALVLFAAYFTMRPYARLVPGRLIGVGMITAFGLFFFLNLTQTLIFLTPLPAYILGWLPTVIIVLLGGFLTLTSEKVG